MYSATAVALAEPPRRWWRSAAEQAISAMAGGEEEEEEEMTNCRVKIIGGFISGLQEIGKNFNALLKQ